MKQLLTLRDQDFDSTIPAISDDDYNLRLAVRAVLLGPGGGVHLLHMANYAHHKLPGGGIDKGETKRQALARELLEEVGCKAELTADVGQITEYKSTYYDGTKQISYCYIARQKGKQKASTFEPDELAEGAVAVHVPNIDAAITLLESDQPNSLEGRFIQRRDLTFLRTAKALLLTKAS